MITILSQLEHELSLVLIDGGDTVLVLTDPGGISEMLTFRTLTENVFTPVVRLLLHEHFCKVHKHLSFYLPPYNILFFIPLTIPDPFPSYSPFLISSPPDSLLLRSLNALLRHYCNAPLSSMGKEATVRSRPPIPSIYSCQMYHCGWAVLMG